jgi:hypothetical protein
MKKLILSLTLSLFAVGAFANLTPTQQAALKANILADPVLSTLQPSSGAIYTIIEAYAAAPAQACIVWRPVLTPDVMRDAIVGGAAQLDNLTVGKRDALLYLISDNLTNTATMRSTLDDLCGTQNTLKAAIVAAEKRPATRLEKLYAAGACTSASPATMSVEGGLSYGDVLQAMGW